MAEKGKYENVERLVCRTDTWACKLALYMSVFAIIYALFDSLTGALGDTLGVALAVLVCIVVFGLPVVIVVQPLTKSELEEYEQSIEE